MKQNLEKVIEIITQALCYGRTSVKQEDVRIKHALSKANQIIKHLDRIYFLSEY